MKSTFCYSEIVRRAQGGDMAALDSLLTHYRAAVLAVTFSRTGRREEAEDLAQEVLIRAQAKLADLRDPGTFPVWLKQIAINCCRDWFRRTSMRVEPLENAEARLAPDASPGPLQALLERERHRQLRRGLLALSDANRLALLMHAWGDYSYQEIAAYLETPVTTVEGRIYRARVQLRRFLKSEAIDDLFGAPRKQREEG